MNTSTEELRKQILKDYTVKMSSVVVNRKMYINGSVSPIEMKSQDIVEIGIDNLLALIQQEQLKLLERIERLNVAEPCETECDDVRHAKHTGAYEHSVYIDSELEKLKAEIKGE